MPALSILLLILALLPTAGRAEDPLRIYAAASLGNALTDIAAAWEQDGHAKATLVFAASATVARQVAAGAPADLFASADRRWMDHLAARGKIVAASRVDLLGNELVLIAPRGRGLAVRMDPAFDLPGAFDGRLCAGEPEVVPAGTYAKQALIRFGWWDALSSRLVGVEDVRTALAFVERGECPLGVVYATDAAISDKVEVVGRFPAGSHDAIVYPFARVTGAPPAAGAFLDHLGSDTAQAIFRRHGFVPLRE